MAKHCECVDVTSLAKTRLFFLIFQIDRQISIVKFVVSWIRSLVMLWKLITFSYNYENQPF